MTKIVHAPELMKLENNLNSTEEICTLTHLASVSSDLITCLVGEKIGSGCYRTVYEYNLDKKYVIKIEPLNTNCNVTEYMLWNEIRGLTGNLAWVKDWFAPVKWISPNGRVLVMQRTKVDYKKEKPKKIPKFMWDVKEDNFGWIGNKFVCHDYGQFYNFISYSKGMQDVGKKW
jgi:hypothetical protein